MALEDELSDYFSAQGWQWTVKTKTGESIKIDPTSDDMLKVLDEAASRLYDGKEGDLVLIGRLCVIKQTAGYDVYVLAGSYN